MEHYSHLKHCIGINCSKRNDCYFQLAWQEYNKEQLKRKYKEVETINHCGDEDFYYIKTTLHKLP